EPIVAGLPGCLRSDCTPRFEDARYFFLEVGFVLVGRRLARQQTLSVPQPELRQPGAKAIASRDEPVRCIRRNEHHVAGGEAKVFVFLDRFSAAADDVSDYGWNHPPLRRRVAGSDIQKTAGEGAEGCDRIAAEDAHIAEGEFPGCEHRRLD